MVLNEKFPPALRVRRKDLYLSPVTQFSTNDFSLDSA